MMKEKVLIAGASGKLGQNMVNELKAQDFWQNALSLRAQRSLQNAFEY